LTLAVIFIGAYRSGGYGVGGFEIWRLWVPPDFECCSFVPISASAKRN